MISPPHYLLTATTVAMATVMAIAEAVLWICSVKSKYINGAVLRIDGGGSIQEQFTLINSKNIEFRG